MAYRIRGSIEFIVLNDTDAATALEDLRIKLEEFCNGVPERRLIDIDLGMDKR